MNDENGEEAQLKVLRLELDSEERLLPYADGGAYRQSEEQIRYLRRRIAALEASIDRQKLGNVNCTNKRKEPENE